MTVVGSGEFRVEKVSSSGKTVWLDNAKTYGFRGVPEEVWNFYIGDYQVCEKSFLRMTAITTAEIWVRFEWPLRLSKKV